jgi:hypothetical protein
VTIDGHLASKALEVSQTARIGTVAATDVAVENSLDVGEKTTTKVLAASDGQVENNFTVSGKTTTGSLTASEVAVDGTIVTQDLTATGGQITSNFRVKGKTTTGSLTTSEVAVDGMIVTKDLTTTNAQVKNSFTVDGQATVESLSASDVRVGGTTVTEHLEVKQAVRGILRVEEDIELLGADLAEDFDVVGTEEIEPGTVVVLDEAGKLRPSATAYDRRVAGVVSGAGNYRPGVILDKQHSSDKRLPVALMGKVYCKADASHQAIRVGDLLTTSPTAGHAMKAVDPSKTLGAVVGKALRPLDAGRGLIPILASLQ